MAWSFNQILPTRLKGPLQMTLDYSLSSKKDKGRVSCCSISNGYLRAIDNRHEDPGCALSEDRRQLC